MNYTGNRNNYLLRITNNKIYWNDYVEYNEIRQITYNNRMLCILTLNNIIHVFGERILDTKYMRIKLSESISIENNKKSEYDIPIKQISICKNSILILNESNKLILVVVGDRTFYSTDIVFDNIYNKDYKTICNTNDKFIILLQNTDLV